MTSRDKYRYLTISVDDGHPADLRVAELLARFGLNATFYIPASNPEREVITPSQIRELATRFEIGAHTLSHVDLTALPEHSAWSEISGSKNWIEDTISEPARAFCYPRGKHNRRLAAMAKMAGFSGARTVMLNITGIPRDPHRWGVSTQAYSHSPLVQIRHAIAERNFAGLTAYGTTFQFAKDWPKHLFIALNHVEKNGGIVHLFLHGWEIAEHQQWGAFERVLQELAARPQLSSVTNGELFSNWHALTAETLASSVEHLREPIKQ